MCMAKPIKLGLELKGRDTVRFNNYSELKTPQRVGL